MLKVLILGVTGFIGRNLTEYFKIGNKYELLIPGRNKLDIMNEKNVELYLKNNQPDVVIHAAIHNPGKDTSKDISKILEYDLRMYYNFEKCSKFYGKMLYFGSGAEYDKTYDIKKVTETDIGRSIPKNDYGLAKYIINQSIRESKNIYNLRVFGLYGPYENWKTTFISGACCKAVKGVPITIRQNVFFDYLWIEDFCKIVEWFVNHTPKYHDYNVVSGRAIDLLSLSSIIRKVSKKDLPVYVCQEGFAKEYTANNDRLLNEIGEFEITEHIEGIKKLYNWYEQQKDKIDLYSLLYQY